MSSISYTIKVFPTATLPSARCGSDHSLPPAVSRATGISAAGTAEVAPSGATTPDPPTAWVPGTATPVDTSSASSSTTTE
jgi:hypothetical protein